MVLNYIWIFFFAVAFIVALFRLVIGGDTEVFSAMMTSTFDMSKTGFEISLGLTGVLTLWMGIMKIGERGGAVQVMSGMINPFFRRLFPGLPQDSPAHGSIMMNLAANMLGLDNAATPMGLKAMQQMQEVNTRKDAASNAQIMFLVLNTSGLTIVPVSIMVYRAQLGAANPTDIFIPILLATYFSTLAGLIAVAIYQKINLFDRVILAYLGGISALMAGVIWYFSTLDKEAVTVVSNVASNIILFGIIMVFIGMAAWKRINVYDAFIEGARVAKHDIFRFDAAKERIFPCLACDHCRTKGCCIHDDGMQKLLPALEQAKIVVFVTPLYYFGMSAQLKSVIDRFYARNAVLRGQEKQALLLAAAYDDNDWTMRDLVGHYRTIVRYMNWHDAGMLLATGCGCRSDVEKTDFLDRAGEMGKHLGA